jgi:hypothetical protein
LGISRDALKTCGAVELILYGIDHNVTQDGVVAVQSLTLTFFSDGAPTYLCEYSSRN